MEVGLSLGSNLGDRLANLQEARRRLADTHGLVVTASSPVYETEPVDVPARFSDKPFLNAILVVDSSLDVRQVHTRARSIEAGMGRRREKERNSPRPIDIDIIYAGQERIRTDELVVPHPRWAERRFVARPLADVRPGLKLPGESRDVKEVLAALPARPVVRIFVSDW
jgi:2-amino-4-hydroxy-6-hydroxymethyldihydropteridine diphosphokinase